VQQQGETNKYLTAQLIHEVKHNARVRDQQIKILTNILQNKDFTYRYVVTNTTTKRNQQNKQYVPRESVGIDSVNLAPKNSKKNQMITSQLLYKYLDNNGT